MIFGDDLADKSNRRVLAASPRDGARDFDEIVPGAIEEAQLRHLRPCRKALGNRAAHALRAVGASPRNRRVESLAQRRPLRLVDRVRNGVLGGREMPVGDFASQPGFLVRSQGDVHTEGIARRWRLFQPPWTANGFTGR